MKSTSPKCAEVSGDRATTTKFNGVTTSLRQNNDPTWLVIHTNDSDECKQIGVTIVMSWVLGTVARLF